MKEIEPPHRKSETPPRIEGIYRALMASSQDAIVGMNREGTIVFWNKGAEQIFGYSAKEILGQHITKLLPEAYSDRQYELITAFLSGNCGETGLIEGEALRKNGSAFPIELSLSLGQHGSEFVALVVASDLTKHKQLEQTLTESAERYCNLFANSLEAVFSTDVSQDMAAGRTALEKLCSYCLKELTAMKSTNALTKVNKEYLAIQIEKLLRTDEPISSIVQEIFRKDGKKILTEHYLNFIKSKNKILEPEGFYSKIIKHYKTEEQLKKFFTNLTTIISRVIEYSDPYTAKHQQRVANLARLVGKNMGLSDDMVERLYFNGLLHDIGKVSIPKSILTKPGSLSEEEWALIRAHTRRGYTILKDANLPWPVAEVALRHHERLDGSGYPNGTAADRLSLEISILAVCDVVEAMGSHRPYRPAKSTTEILKELRDGKGTKYDANVVDAMMPMIEGEEFKSVWNGGNFESAAT